MAEHVPTIGVITALPLEQAAIVALLDDPKGDTIESAGVRWPVTFDTIPSVDGIHRAVITQCGMDNTNVATCATFLLSHFDQLGALLMINIAGGVPCPFPDRLDHHVPLGDIVVSDGYGEVQYDFIKQEVVPGEYYPRITYHSPPILPSTYSCSLRYHIAKILHRH